MCWVWIMLGVGCVGCCVTLCRFALGDLAERAPDRSLRIMCHQSTLEVTFSEDEDDRVSSDEEGEHNVLNFFLDVVAQSSPEHACGRLP